ncbi:hypothetical protein GCM10027568_31980 [Humibacter soli]
MSEVAGSASRSVPHADHVFEMTAQAHFASRMAILAAILRHFWWVIVLPAVIVGAGCGFAIWHGVTSSSWGSAVIGVLFLVIMSGCGAFGFLREVQRYRGLARESARKSLRLATGFDEDGFWFIRNGRPLWIPYAAIGTVRVSLGWVLLWTRTRARTIGIPRELVPQVALNALRHAAQRNQRAGRVANPWRLSEHTSGKRQRAAA